MKLKPGDLGEEAAKVWFRTHGWSMERTQPEAVIQGRLTWAAICTLKQIPLFRKLWNAKNLYVVALKKGGVSDFTGHKDGLYRAVEVKEATGDTCPCSRLDSEQRRFMDALPAGCAYVYVFWMDRRKGQMFEYKPKGSYKYREG